jgi:hypothetical protein
MINVWLENLHVRFGFAEFAKTELTVKAVSVASCQTESPQPVQDWMAHHEFHQPLCQTFSAMVFQNVDVAEISIGGGIGDDASETNLILAVEQGEAQRICDGALAAEYPPTNRRE